VSDHLSNHCEILHDIIGVSNNRLGIVLGTLANTSWKENGLAEAFSVLCHLARSSSVYDEVDTTPYHYHLSSALMFEPSEDRGKADHVDGK
jgi:hypothetical protein